MNEGSTLQGGKACREAMDKSFEMPVIFWNVYFGKVSNANSVCLLNITALDVFKEGFIWSFFCQQSDESPNPNQPNDKSRIRSLGANL